MRKYNPCILASIVGLVFLSLPVVSGQDGEGRTGEEVVSPLEMLDRGRLAFQQSDFVAAEMAFDQFFADYAENPEAAEAINAHRPLLALTKVGVGKYDEASPLIDASLKSDKLEAKLKDELSFWRGICLMQSDDYSAAQESLGEYWNNEKHEPFKRYEALLLFAGLYLTQGFDEFAADFLKERIPKMRKLAPEAASRATVLRFHALLKAGENEQALELVRSEYSGIDQMTQLISFQMQVLDLGARFLEEKQYRKAVFCLQRVWSKEKLLRRQETRLKGMHEREEKVMKQGGRQAVLFQIRSIIRRVEREISMLEESENFDSGLRLRVAVAFQSQERYREAALVMGEMLEKMPPDSVVDSASVALIQCWMQIERWPKAVESADLYLKTLGIWEEAAHFPEVMLLKAEALKEMQQPQKAAVVYGDLVERFPKHKQAPSALFMQAYMYLIQDDSEGAVYHFDQLRLHYSEHALVEDADYWTGMALSFTSEYSEAKGWLQVYLNRYGALKVPAKYRVEAKFRLAYCVFAMGDNAQAITLFRRFIDDNEGHDLIDEARLLLGDGYLGEGEIERGIESYRRISPESKRFHEDGWFKIGKALRLTDDLVGMRDHFTQFLSRYPDSSRMPEAVYWIGWVDRQHGDIAKAKQVYWQTLRAHGNGAKYLAIEDLIAALPRLYRDTGEGGQQELLKGLEELELEAVSSGQRLLALRCAWGVAQVYRKQNQKAYRVALLKVTPEVDAKHDAPRITVDCADAQLAMGNLNVAEKLYETVRKWHPRAVERDRVFAGLGRIAEMNGEVDQAIAYYLRFERETASVLRLNEVKLERARLLVRKLRSEEARGVLEEILESPIKSSRIKAQALFEFGEILMSEGDPRKAAAYYERIYVVYGKHKELVARAYWRRGEALEKMSLRKEALEVYGELAEREDLSACDEAKMAARKLMDMNRVKGASS